MEYIGMIITPFVFLRSRLEEIQRVKEQLKGFKAELQRCQRSGDLGRAGELTYECKSKSFNNINLIRVFSNN